MYKFQAQSSEFLKVNFITLKLQILFRIHQSDSFTISAPLVKSNMLNKISETSFLFVYVVKSFFVRVIMLI